MKIEFLLLTKSDMFGGYCVAGINLGTNEWVRLKMEEHEEIPRTLFKYSNGKEPEIMDVIAVNVNKKAMNNTTQPENRLMCDNSFKKIGVGGKKILTNRIAQDGKKDKIFYSQSYLISNDELEDIKKEDRYSLMIIKPSNLRFKWFPGKDKRRLKAYFGFNSLNYGGFLVTDLQFKSEVWDHNNWEEFYVDDKLLVISLAQESRYNPNYFGKHFKLIASVI